MFVFVLTVRTPKMTVKRGCSETTQDLASRQRIIVCFQRTTIIAISKYNVKIIKETIFDIPFTVTSSL